jgi:hypothetical protein
MGQGHVSFNRTQTQYLDGGPLKFNIASNGGLTVVVVVRFTGSPGKFERIIDFADGPMNNSLILARKDMGSNLLFQLREGSIKVCEISSVIVQDQWMTIVARYRAQNQTCALEVNGQRVVSTTGSVAITDKTLSMTWVGRSQWSSDAYLHGNMAGLYVNDQYASDEQCALIADALQEGLDLTESGRYAAAAGSTVCNICSTGKYSGLAASTDCTSCEAGKFSGVAGSSVCTNWIWVHTSIHTYICM